MSLASRAEITGQAKVLRRELHKIPELGGREYKTLELVAEFLRQVGVDTVETGIGGTGVVATIKGIEPDTRSIGLRADMDGLPIAEHNNFAYRSTHEGRMHACGHDGHMAILLGVAAALTKSRQFTGTAVLIFQPAEEGLAGAREMVRDGLFSRYPVDEIYALHNWPELPLGEIGVCPSEAMAARDDFQIEIVGKGGHAAQPHKTIDPILVGARVIEALQSIVSRELDPQQSGVISIHSLRGGGEVMWGQPTESVSIPENLYLGGIAKWMVPSVGKLLQRRIGEIANCVAEVSGATAKLAYTQFLPPVINNKACAKRVVVASRRTVPEVQVHADMPPTMASEDFSFMLNEVPGAYFFLGAGREGQKPLHHPSFDFNDDAIPLGIEIMMQLVEGE